ncbi:MAG: nucleoside deaminase [Bacteroidales bacterium]|jgi:tRNA(Arg) A34 adenosine deaminase TadA
MEPVFIESHDNYFKIAFEEAFKSLRTNIGGPFGAVVVKDGKIIGKGGNQVISQNDPTAHAEIVAIREACRNISNFDLSGAAIYATCEPCPMCLSAIYWANIKEVYYCSTRFQAETIGFRDNHIYEEINLLPEERTISFHQVTHPEAARLFREWTEKKDKMPY